MNNYDLLAFDSSFAAVDSSLSCREVSESDFDAVLDIESASFEFPWSRQDFEFCLDLEQCGALVAECNGKIVGYVVYEARRNSVRLLSCAVVESERRSGVGSFLLHQLADRLGKNRSQIVCIVRERNVTAQLFLRSLGFRAQWINRRFYSSAEEDAYRMTWRLDNSCLLGFEYEQARQVG